MSQFYYNPLYRNDSSSEEELSVPMEEKDDIFDDDRNKHHPVGSVLGTSAANSGIQGTTVSPVAGNNGCGAVGNVAGTGTMPAAGTVAGAGMVPSSGNGTGTVAGASTGNGTTVGAGAGTISSQGTTTPSVALPSACGSGSSFPVESIEYTQGYLRTQIGRRVRVQFLLGTGTFQDRTGVLLEVGISYIILRNEETNANVLCDIYSIKFVDFF